MLLTCIPRYDIKLIYYCLVYDIIIVSLAAICSAA